MSRPHYRLLIGVAIVGLFIVGCAVAINLGSGKATTDSHDKDSHDAEATNSRSFDVNISPR